MSLGFNDLDTDLQRSVFSAILILGLVLVLALVTILHYILLGFCFVVSGWMAYKLFLKPKLSKKKNGSVVVEAEVLSEVKEE